MLKKLLVSEKIQEKRRRKVIFCFLVSIRDGGCRWYLIFCFQHAIFHCFPLLACGLYELNRSLINHAWFKRHCWIFFLILVAFRKTWFFTQYFADHYRNKHTINSRMGFHCSLLKLRKIFFFNFLQWIIEWISLFYWYAFQG